MASSIRKWNAAWIGDSKAKNDPVVPVHPTCFGTSEHMEMLKDHEYCGICPILRKEFIAGKSITKATAYACGLGFFEFYINGQKPDDRVLIPAKTDYSHDVRYETFDVTPLINSGNNCIGVMLGNGWFNPQPRFWGWQMQWYGTPRLIFELELEYADGSIELVSSDESWKIADGPVRFSGIYCGESYDARLEREGWNSVGFDDSDWRVVEVVKAPWQGRERDDSAKILPSDFPPPRIVETLKPVRMYEPRAGVYVYDFGKNITGWVRLRVKGHRGNSVRMVFSEAVYSQGGMVDLRNLYGIDPTDIYILKSEEEEIWEPRFTWHGFRYVELTGFPGTPTLENLEGSFVHNDVQQIGEFSCDDSFVNRLHQGVITGQLGNLQCGVPLDCPQRNERLGWLGDAHATCQEAVLNFDMYSFYRKWLADIRAQQDKSGNIGHIAPRPGIVPKSRGDAVWSSAIFIVPWCVWLETGNLEILSDNYESMKRYLDFLSDSSEEGILPIGRYGDHLSVDKKFQHHSGIPNNFYTAFYYHGTDICSKAAELLGFEQEAKDFLNCANTIKDSFNRRFLKDGVYDDGSQAAFAIPISFGMMPEEESENIIKAFIATIENDGYHPTTGLIGTRYLPQALDLCNRPDVFWKMLKVEGFPGWKHLLGDNHTTLPEQWDGSGSLNHIVLGSIDYWFYRTLAGICINQQNPGYRSVLFKPFFPDTLNHVEAAIKTVRGRIGISWNRVGDKIEVCLKVPPDVQYSTELPSNACITEVLKCQWTL